MGVADAVQIITVFLPADAATRTITPAEATTEVMRIMIATVINAMITTGAMIDAMTEETTEEMRDVRSFALGRITTKLKSPQISADFFD